MPTYRNNSRNPVVINNTTFKFNIPTEINFYFKEDDYPMLVKTSDDPIYNPVVFSQKLAVGAELDVVANITNEVSTIRIVAITNTSSIIFNGLAESEIFIAKESPLELKNTNYYKTIKNNSGGEISIELWKGVNWF